MTKAKKKAKPVSPAKDRANRSDASEELHMHIRLAKGIIGVAKEARMLDLGNQRDRDLNDALCAVYERLEGAANALDRLAGMESS
jgi:hypothetical protein